MHGVTLVTQSGSALGKKLVQLTTAVLVTPARSRLPADPTRSGWDLTAKSND